MTTYLVPKGTWVTPYTEKNGLYTGLRDRKTKIDWYFTDIEAKHQIAGFIVSVTSSECDGFCVLERDIKKLPEDI